MARICLESLFKEFLRTKTDLCAAMPLCDIAQCSVEEKSELVLRGITYNMDIPIKECEQGVEMKIIQTIQNLSQLCLYQFLFSLTRDTRTLTIATKKRDSLETRVEKCKSFIPNLQERDDVIIITRSEYFNNLVFRGEHSYVQTFVHDGQFVRKKVFRTTRRNVHILIVELEPLLRHMFNTEDTTFLYKAAKSLIPLNSFLAYRGVYHQKGLYSNFSLNVEDRDYGVRLIFSHLVKGMLPATSFIHKIKNT